MKSHGLLPRYCLLHMKMRAWAATTPRSTLYATCRPKQPSARNDGTRMERTVESTRGSEYKFASEADIVDPFEQLAIKALPQSQVEQLRDAMLGLDKLEDAARIAQLLGKR